MNHKAVFLDRDGTLIEERGYLADPDQVVLMPHTVPGLRRLRQAGFLLVGITNQSGVARGYFPEAAVGIVNARVDTLLAAEGLALNAWQYCPHGPGDACACRKPLPGMFHAAAEVLGIDLVRSAAVGDQPRDAEAGAAAGCPLNILIGPPRAKTPFPAAPDIMAAAELILEQLGS